MDLRSLGRQPAGAPSKSGRPAARAGLVAAGVLVLATAGWLGWRRMRPAEEAGIKSLAVLPPKSLQAQGKEDYLEVGLADAIITKVSKIRGLSVRPTSVCAA
ncbi:MAG: hypothetical protein FJW20_01610 [Acidimicrobiia bacterium]|nr:hypothetical protein [Acidimicrobiia bacterium]